MDLTTYRSVSSALSEDEVAVLKDLPRNKEELAQYLAQQAPFISNQAWIVLLEEVVQIISDQQYQIIKKRIGLASGLEQIADADRLNQDNVSKESSLSTQMRDYFMDGMK